MTFESENAVLSSFATLTVEKKKARNEVASKLESASPRVREIWSKIYFTSKRERFENCGSNLWLEKNSEGLFRLQVNGCNLRWCPKCARHRRGKQLRKIKLFSNCAGYLKFITLTLRSSDEDLRTQIEKLQNSFRRLRHQKNWKKNFSRGIGVIEVTYSNCRRQWHPHLHVLAEGAFYSQDKLSMDWKRASRGSSVVDIRTANRDAGKYIAKYVSKLPDVKSWNDPEKRAAEIATAFHKKRSIISFGNFDDLMSEGFEAEVDRTWKTLCSASTLRVAALKGESWANEICQEIFRQLGRTGLEQIFFWRPP